VAPIGSHWNAAADPASASVVWKFVGTVPRAMFVPSKNCQNSQTVSDREVVEPFVITSWKQADCWLAGSPV
jgi:hypothetical protein